MSLITSYTALTAPATGDVLPIVDISDTTMSGAGTTKQITIANLMTLAGAGGASLAIAAAPITADPAPAVVNTFYPVDTSGGAVTITLPNAPANGTLVGAKLVKQTGTNAVTIQRNGSGTDVFNVAAGATSLPSVLTLLNQGITLQYLAAPKIWYVVGDDVPLPALQTTAMALSNKTLTAALETVSTNATATGSLTVSVATANIFFLTVTGALSLTLALSGSGTGVSEALALYLLQDGTGHAVSFTNTITWMGGGGAPTISSSPGILTVLSFEAIGGAWYGAAVTGAPSLPLTVANGGTGSSTGTASQYTAPASVTLTDAATISVNAALGNDMSVVLGASGHTLGNPASPSPGQKILFRITQGSSGGPYMMSFGTAYQFTTAIPQPTLSTGANVTDLVGFAYDSGRSKWLILGVSLGYT